jgi:two-component system, NarL family, response regulator DegU
MGATIMIFLAVADDHELFAEGVRNALHTQPDFTVSVVVSNGDDLLTALETSRVDVALIDYEMPGGGESLVTALSGRVKTIVVTMFPEAEERLAAAGAHVVLSKSTPLMTLAAAIRATQRGITIPASGPSRDELLAGYTQPELDPGARALTDREIELLRVLARGVSSTEELAETLFISQKTVKNHLASIFSKLAVSDRTQAAIEAIRLGIADSR